MSIEIKHIRGSTVRITATFKDYDGKEIDPETKDAVVTDPEGADKTGTISWENGTDKGVYWFYYTIPADGMAGTWNVRVSGVAADWSDIKDKKFEVSE